MAEILTQSEADTLIAMLKSTTESTVQFPPKGSKTIFKAKSDTSRDTFEIQIFRSKISDTKIYYSALLIRNKVVLLSLDVGDSLKHKNPDGTVIIGSHWHIYSEQYGRQMAIPASDINSSDFSANTMKFFNDFHLIKKPDITYQETLDF